MDKIIHILVLNIACFGFGIIITIIHYGDNVIRSRKDSIENLKLILEELKLKNEIKDLQNNQG
jgi:hypothetical protein